jgi:hypothetical protein
MAAVLPRQHAPRVLKKHPTTRLVPLLLQFNEAMPSLEIDYNTSGIGCKGFPPDLAEIEEPMNAEA